MTWSGIPLLAAAEAAPMRNEWHEYDAGGMPDLARTWRKWWRNQDCVAPFPV